MKELSPVTPFKGPNDEGGATRGHADDFNLRQEELIKRDEELLEELNSSNAQTAQLSNGLNIVEADQSSVADVLIQGRTMINQINYSQMNMHANSTENYIEPGIITERAFGSRKTSESSGSEHIQLRSTERTTYSLKANKYYLCYAWLKVKELGEGPPLPKLSLRLNGQTNTIVANGNNVVTLNEWLPSRVLINPKEDTIVLPQIEILQAGSKGDILVDALCLYELTHSEYIEALNLNVRDIPVKFPYVEGVKHILNPVITKKGKNLLPPFTNWKLHESTQVEGPYKIKTISSTPSNNATSVTVPALPNTTYTFSYSGSERARGRVFSNSANNSLALTDLMYAGSHNKETFITKPDTYQLIIFQDVGSQETGEFIFEYPILTIGEHSVFEPQNDDFLYSQTLLGSTLDGKVRDFIYRKEDRYFLREYLNKDVIIDDTLEWANHVEIMNGIVSVRAPMFSGMIEMSGKLEVLDEKGIPLPKIPYMESKTEGAYIGRENFVINLPLEKTGWQEDRKPSPSEIKTFFRNHIYRMQYELQNPIEHTLRIEGAIGIHDGSNLLEIDSGLIIREKATPAKGITAWHINHKALNTPSNLLNHRAAKIIAVYRDGTLDKTWNTMISEAYGKQRVNCPLENYDESAEYTVTYIAEDKHELTTSVDKASVTYQTSLKASHDKSVQQITANTSEISTLNLMMGEIIKLFRVMGGE